MTWHPLIPHWPDKTCEWASHLPVEAADFWTLLDQGRRALRQQFDQSLGCLTLTPYQPGIGQGQGQQRFLSANNLMAQMGNQLLDFTTTHDDNHALAIIALAATADELAETLARLNGLLPIPELQRCERRARLLAALESEKWHKPVAASLPQWGSLALQHLPVTRDTRQALNARLTEMDNARPSTSARDALKQLANRKQARQQANSRRMATLQNSFSTGVEHLNLRVRRVGPGTPSELRRQLLDGAAPGPEWIMCAGVVMIGNEQALAFISELVGL